jgi:redox-sensitive bicupin YhaK (pirin superfamily)
MSNLDRTPPYTTTGGSAGVAARPVHEFFRGRVVPLGESTQVRRLLPNLGRRLVGAWCFVDHYGPDDISDAPGMQVPPHPHIGLQTVSWLLDGEVHHRDSLGSDAVISPGELGLMTAGTGIAHAEHSPVARPSLLHGVQLWVALPADAPSAAPAWQHEADLPVLRDSGLTATVILGDLGGARSPGATFSPLVGVDVDLGASADALVPLEPEWEYGLLAMSGEAQIENATLEVGSMLYLGCGRRDLRLQSTAGARLLLLGGAPFEEQIVMWWNFVGHSADEIEQARLDWESGAARFGSVRNAGARLAAPPLPPGRLRPGGRTR